MSYFKEMGKYMVKYGEIAITKTEVLAQMAKLKIEIKKRDMEIEKVKLEIGEYVIEQFEKQEEISSDVIKFKIDHMNNFRAGIDELKFKYETTKSSLWETPAENQEGNKPE